MNQISPISRARPGRPTKKQAEARHAELLDRAIDHFLESGFEKTTIEAIASDVNMTKRTVYARYSEKADLFKAAVKRAIERHSVPVSSIEATRADDLEQTLKNVAMLRINLVATPEGLKLQRILSTESYRFPEIFGMAYELNTLPTVRFLIRLFEEETAAGRLAIDQPERTALAFMSMVVGGPVQFITSGNPLPKSELNERVAFAVNLFLEGAKPR